MHDIYIYIYIYIYIVLRYNAHGCILYKMHPPLFQLIFAQLQQD
jgi:hypothetical protein